MAAKLSFERFRPFAGCPHFAEKLPFAPLRSMDRGRPVTFGECGVNRLFPLLLSQKGAQPFGGRRATLAYASERDRRGFEGVLPLVRLAIRVYRVNQQAPAGILSHVRHDAKPIPNLKDIARVNPME
jgi:hypothetical protein